MSETNALFRLALIQYRLGMICIAGIVAIGVSTALLWGGASNDPAVHGTAQAILVFAMIPAAVWLFALFDFGTNPGMIDGCSGYSPWLLRMPISSWKLALVPVVLKTLWAVVMWIVFALTVRAISGYPLGLLSPAFFAAAVGIWFSVLGWRPFANGWWRLAAVIGYGGIGLLTFVGIVIAHDQSTRLEPWMRQAISGVAFVIYGLGVWMSVRVIDLTRTNSAGLISANRRNKSASTDADAFPPRYFGSPHTALIRHDLSRAGESLRNFFVIGVVPTIVLTWLLVPISIVGFVFVTMLFVYAGVGASTFAAEMAKSNSRVVLTPYLAASPLRTSTIAWTRLAVGLAILACAMLLCAVACASTFLWAENREIFSQWSAEMAKRTGWSHAGPRIATAIFLGTWILIAGRAVAHWWPALCGKPWLQIGMVIVFLFSYFVPIGVVIYWFIQQDSWETTKASALYWARFVPPIVITWLVFKAAGFIAAVVTLRRMDLASLRSIAIMTALWCLFAGTVATLFDQLIPHPQASLLWCFAAVAICTPLVRLLLLPVSLYFGRHP